MEGRPVAADALLTGLNSSLFAVVSVDRLLRTG